MKFKTRLVVTFVTIIAIPLVLCAAAFLVISIYLMNVRNGYPVKELDYSLIANIHLLVSHQLLVDMIIAMILILIFTGWLLTRWIQKSVFNPLSELNVAMTKIKEGDFDFDESVLEKGADFFEKLAEDFR